MLDRSFATQQRFRNRSHLIKFRIGRVDNDELVEQPFSE